MAEVSIIIATYNRPEFLEEAIDSALSQSVKCEVLVANDGGFQKTLPDRFANFARFYDLPHQGAPKTLNFLYGEATGNYIFNLDDDDLLAENTIERLLDTINGHDVAFCDLLLYPEMVPFRQEYNGYEALKLNNTMPDPRLMTKEMAIKVPVPDMEAGWDYERWLQICEVGGRIAHCPEFLYYYRQHPGQIQKTRPEEQTKNNLLSKQMRNIK